MTIILWNNMIAFATFLLGYALFMSTIVQGQGQGHQDIGQRQNLPAEPSSSSTFHERKGGQTQSHVGITITSGAENTTHRNLGENESKGQDSDGDSGGGFIDTHRLYSMQRIHPTRGPLSGGSSVLVTSDAELFVDGTDLECKFGDISVMGRWITPSRVECLSPKQSTSGSVNVVVTSGSSNSGHGRVGESGTNEQGILNETLQFDYYEETVITHVSPSHGPATGGMNITLSTNRHLNPLDDLVCRFDTHLVPGYYLNASNFVCKAPLGQTGRLVQISVSRNGGHDFSPPASDFFEYVSRPFVKSISPLIGGLSRGAVVRIKGSGFQTVDQYNSSDLNCFFDNIKVSATIYSNHEVRCRAPSATSVSTVPLSLVIGPNDHNQIVSSWTFQYIEDYEVTAVLPLVGEVSGGTIVVLSGFNFPHTESISCMFGDHIVQAAFSGIGQIICTSPPNGARVIPLRLSFDGVEFEDTGFNFTYRTLTELQKALDESSKNENPLIVSSINPPSCSNLEEAIVAVAVQNIVLTEAYICMFGESVLIPVTSLNKTHVECTTPLNMTTGEINLSIHRNGIIDHDNNRGADFIFTGSPIVNDVRLSSSGKDGIPSIIATGQNFIQSSDLVCQLGATYAQAKWISQFQVECIPPTDLSTFATFSLSNDGIEFATKELNYDAAQKFSISSTRYDPLERYIHIKGTNFVGNTTWSCFFDRYQIVSYVISPNQMLCEVPEHILLLPKVHLQICRGENLCSEDHLIDIASNVIVRQISPLYGLVHGGTRVQFQMEQMEFDQLSRFKCVFGDLETSVGNDLDASYMLFYCHSPPISDVQTVKFFVTMDGLPVTYSGLYFEYLQEVILTDIEPRRVQYDIETPITVRLLGSGFVNKPEMTCTIDGKSATESIWISESEVWCLVDDLKPGSKTISIKYDSVMSGTMNSSLIVEHPMQITSMRPICGPGGSLVELCGTNLKSHQEVLFCHFHKDVGSAEHTNDSCVRCIVPFQEKGGNVTASLSMDGIKPVKSLHRFRYASPRITSVTPTFIQKESGKRILTLKGDSFGCLVPETVCQIGEMVSSPVVIQSENSIRCSFHSLSELGTFPIILKNPFFEIVGEDVSVEIVPIPAILSVTPSLMIEGESKKVEIHGTNFYAGNFTCLLDEDRTSKAIVITENHAICLMPRCQPGMKALHVSNDGISLSETFKLECIPAISLSKISPRVGLPGTVINITGTQFRENLNCSLVSFIIVKALIVNSTLVQCVIPPQATPMTISINLIMDGNSVGVNGGEEGDLNFTIVDLAIESITPDHGTIDVSTPVSVQLAQGHSKDVSHCWFGEHIVEATIKTGDEVVCVAPARGVVGVVSIGLSSNGLDSTMEGILFEYIEKPRILSIEPTMISEVGGTNVRLFGIAFPDKMDLQCVLGDSVFVSAEWISENEVHCIMPSMVPGDYTVRISSNGKRAEYYQSDDLLLNIFDAVILTKVSPTMGIVRGGTHVKVYGTNFQMVPKVLCAFDDINIKAAYISANEVHCITPPAKMTGISSLKIMMNKMESKNSINFLYIEPFHFVGVGPNNGGEGGEMQIIADGNEEGYNINEHVNGEVFYCVLNERKILAKIRGNSLVCQISPGLEEEVGVSILHGNHTYPVKDGFFTVERNVVVTKIYPKVLSESLKTSITIGGRQFRPGSTTCCRFSSHYIVPAVVKSDNIVQCSINPRKANMPNKFSIEVSNSCNGGFSQAIELLLKSNPVITEVRPKRGISHSGHTISIFGMDLNTNDSINCFLIPLQVIDPAHIVNSTLVQCVIPPQATPMTISINLIMDGNSVGVNGGEEGDLNFTIVDLAIESITPDHGTIDVSTPVSVQLAQGHSKDVSHCWFGEHIVEATIKTGDEVVCVAPARGVAGFVSIGLSSNGLDSTMEGILFEYIEKPRILSIEPTMISEVGGTNVRLFGIAFPDKMDLQCVLGDSVFVSAEWISENEVHCIMPSMVPGDYTVRISTNNKDADDNKITLAVHPAVVLREAYLIHRGARLHLDVHGSGFVYNPMAVCRIGDEDVLATIIDNQLLSCKLPFSFHLKSKRFVEVSVAVDGQHFTHSFLRVTAPPKIYRVLPSKDPSHGGRLLTVEGDFDYQEGESSLVLCKIDDKTSPALLQSNVTILCGIPELGDLKDEARIAISLDNGLQWSNYLYFKLHPPLEIHSFYPLSASIEGDTIISIKGDHFRGDSIGLKCEFGRVLHSSVTWISTSELQCRTMSHPPAIVSLGLVDELNHTIGSRKQFEFFDAPIVFSFSPLSGSVGGETIVRVLGKHLDVLEEPLCMFGQIPSKATILGSMAISCNTPAMDNDGEVVISIVDATTGFEWICEGYFRYIQTPIITTISHLRPEEDVSILGEGFNATGDIWCRFSPSNSIKGVSVVKGSFLTANKAICPSFYSWLATDSSTTIAVSTNGEDWSWEHSAPITQSLLFVDVYPRKGSTSGGTRVRLESATTIHANEVACFFGDSAVQGIVLSGRIIQCTSPKVSGAEAVALSLSLEGSGRMNTNYIFQYISPCIVRRIEPNVVSNMGASLIAVHGNGFEAFQRFTCRFGTIYTPAFITNSSALACAAPPSREQSLNLSIIVDETQDICVNDSSDIRLKYVVQSKAINVFPNIIQIRKIMNVTIRGEDFIQGAKYQCNIGFSFSPAIFYSPNEIRCSLRAQDRVGLLPFSLSSKDISFTSEVVMVRFAAAPFITGVNETSLPSGTSSMIEVRGYNFINSPYLECNFGETYLSSLATWLSQKYLLCETPILHGDSLLPLSVTNNNGHDVSNIHQLEVKARMQLLWMKPSSGFITRGSFVTARIRGLSPNAKYVCLVGIITIKAEVFDYSTIRCKIPKQEKGVYEVFFQSAYESIRLGTFEVYLPPEYVTIEPSHGPLCGGTEISIRGRNLDNMSFCRFTSVKTKSMEEITPVVAVGTGDIICFSPVSDVEGEFDLSMSIDGSSFTDIGIVFTYTRPPRILSLEPKSIPSSGGTRVEFTGLHFLDSSKLSCKFGSQVVEARFLTQEVIYCVAPETSIGSKLASVSTNGVDFVGSYVVSFYPIPFISSIHPEFGGIDGGTQVLLTISNATPNRDIQCRFGDTLAPALYINFNTLSCHSPRVQTDRIVSISVTMNKRDYHGGSGDCCTFRYLNRPVISYIQPTQGPSKGGTRIRVYVDDIDVDVSRHLLCHFGQNVFVTPIEYGATFVDCISPKAPFGVNAYHLSLHYRSTSPLSSFEGPLFTYLKPFLVDKVTPPCGSVQGGTLVTVSGYNFPKRNDLQCMFGGISSPAELFDDRTIKCVSPIMNKTGSVLVTVTSFDNSIKAQHSPAYFEYNLEHSIHLIYPHSGVDKGGTTITVTGDKFLTSRPDLTMCRFGREVVNAKVKSRTELVCISPPFNNAMVPSGMVTFGVALNGKDFVVNNEISFQYIKEMRVLSIHPNYASNRHETPVKISVISPHMVYMGDIRCHFGNASNLVEDIVIDGDLHHIYCRSPVSQHIGMVPFELTVHNSNDMTSTNLMFNYFTTPSVISISPRIGFASGGELITVSGTEFTKNQNLHCMFGNQLSPLTRWLSSRKIECLSPPVYDVESVPVYVTSDGTVSGMIKNPTYSYKKNPIFDNVSNTMVDSDGSTLVTISGRHLSGGILCRFGKFADEVPVIDFSDNTIVCKPPALKSSSPYLDATAEVFVSYQSGFINTGLSIHYNGYDDPNEVYSDTLNDQFDTPVVLHISPTSGYSSGGIWITVKGKRFSNREGLGCLFGGATFISAQFISSEQIRCLSPAIIPGGYHVQVTNGGKYDIKSTTGVSFHVSQDIMIDSIVPAFGHLIGGTVVTVKGSFPNLQRSEIKRNTLLCRFGNIDVPAVLRTSRSIICVTPPVLKSQTVRFSISLDNGSSFSKSAIRFSFLKQPHVTRISPNAGVQQGGTRVVVEGVNFIDSVDLVCRFGMNKSTQGIFISGTRIMCISSSSLHKSDASLEISFNGVDYISSNTSFHYLDALSIVSVHPPSAPALVRKNTIYITLEGMKRDMEIHCLFNHFKVDAVVIDSNIVSCMSPGLDEGFVSLRLASYAADQATLVSKSWQYFFYSIPTVTSTFPHEEGVTGRLPLFIEGTGFLNSTNMKCQFDEIITRAVFLQDTLIMCTLPPLFNEKNLTVKVSPSGYDFPWLPSVDFKLEGDCPLGHYCSFSTTSWTDKAPNGTKASVLRSSNFTLCDPGTFAPRTGMDSCLVCPIGYICPDFGLSKPIICPSGRVCEYTGLVSPSSPCPPGHYCNMGTKTSYPIVLETGEHWQVDYETNVATERRNESFYSSFLRKTPATGRYNVEHLPAQRPRAEQPFPCPIGFYCREGVATNISVSGNFSTPQPCYDGFFCPRGSISPEGSGPCSPGFYCPSATEAIVCPEGHYCSGVGNTKPLECYPGTFSNSTGQSNCHLCDFGYICPLWGLSSPELCPAGFVCDKMGLSVPEKMCPQGYFCEIGTSTDKVEATIQSRPKPCPPGVFCLAGVAHDTSLDWLPNQLEGKFAPQTCVEGYFCEEASSSPRGSGPCFPGHYCPPGTPYPVPVPAGSFADGGAIVPALCFPGTYTPIKGYGSCLPCPAGYSCEGYGTRIPKICSRGTYRSKADGVSCKLCPTGTFLPYQGSTDVTQCLPCPPGRVCGEKSLPELSGSLPCDGGYICSSTTEGSNQYNHKCSSGHICGKETTPMNQFDTVCESGYSCKRGTSIKLRHASRCTKKQFCPYGTPGPGLEMNQCPRQTSSRPGSLSMRSCNIQVVDVCDKLSVNPTNPGEKMSYYSDHSYSPLDNSSIGNLIIGLSDKIGHMGEVIATKKIIPIDIQGSQLWHNDTIEVLRTCPTYAITNSSEWSGNVSSITLIGRNLRGSDTLTCRYRTLSDIDEFEIRKAGTFISKTRMSCPLPKVSEIVGILTQSYHTCLQSQGSLFMPCDESERDTNHCENIPSIGLKTNPCFSTRFMIDLSNDGTHFSGDEVLVPYTADGDIARQKRRISLVTAPSIAQFTVIRPFVPNDEDGHTRIMKASQILWDEHSSLCLHQREDEEGQRASENGWFQLQFMTQAQLTIDWRHISPTLAYDEHFKLAIYTIPSRCDDTLCTERRTRAANEETNPCVKPLLLPNWFIDPIVPKQQLLNMTLLALDDALVKVEIQIVHGLFLPSTESFEGTVQVDLVKPNRAKVVSMGDGNNTGSQVRILSPHISREEAKVPMEYIFATRLTKEDTRTVSPPLNLPPRWQELERGRVLLSMNTTHRSTTPTVRDTVQPDRVKNTFWDNPFQSIEEAKEMTDAFLETFHGLHLDVDGTYQYDMENLMLPYLPFFSNCREFDSYIPFSHAIESNECELPQVDETFPFEWWRRQFSPLPHQDYIQAVGPFDINKFYPVADWCERKIYCSYEEELEKQDLTPRWFEADHGTTIFSLIRDPVNFYQYTGRQGARTSLDDGGGNKFIKSITVDDTFIPVKIARTTDPEVCSFLCFPRTITLDVSYFQLDNTVKRLVEINLILDDFDKNITNLEYEMNLQFHPLNYQELIVKFAFDREIFLILFFVIGLITVILAFLYWLVVRLTTQLESPPNLRFMSTFWLIFPQALSGFSMGLIPIVLATTGISLLLKGYMFFTPELDPQGIAWPIFQSTLLHYKDSSIDPKLLQTTRQGRLGMAFLTIAIVSIFEGSKMFVPNRESKRERELEVLREKEAGKTMVWNTTKWKRSNLICTSIFMGLFLVVIVEASYWSLYGKYIWQAILLLKIVNNITGKIVDNIMGEALLSAPIMTAMGLVENIVTLAAVDFIDFLLTYIVGFGFLILDRMYISPYEAEVTEWMRIRILNIYNSIEYTLRRKLNSNGNSIERKAKLSMPKREGTIEPIINSYGSYSMDTLSLFYVPYVIVLLMVFRQDIEMPARYGIKEQEMEYYASFALLIIPFQILADIFLQSSLELFHGWKMHDYLEYAKYRFLQRETRWKGFEDSLDECIEESTRTIDHMCFSTQYYLMMTIHVNGIIYMVLGIEMINRAEYNLFGDPATPIVLALVLLCVTIMKQVLLRMAIILNIWRIRKENTAWHANLKDSDFNLPDLDGIKGASHDAFEMNKRISSETFRYKFLNYNRSWLIEQLPSVLTPRTLRRSRPFLSTQIARVIQTLNDGISSDSDSEADAFNFPPPDLSQEAKTVLTDWVKEAKRRLMLKDAVQPFIERARGGYCERCLSRKQLKVQTELTIDEMDESFKERHPEDTFDRGLWKQFWFRHQKYHTICLPCISSEKDTERRYPAEEETDQGWGAIMLEDAGRAMMTSWYKEAKQNLFGPDEEGTGNDVNVAVDISDDEDGDDEPFAWTKEQVALSKPTSDIAVLWLRSARSRMQSGDTRRGRPPVR